MENFIEVLQTVVQNIVLSSVDVIMSYFGWKANSERNKLKAEIEGMRACNTEQEIKKQSSWIDLYEKLHDNQARRIVELDAKVSELSKELNTFKNAFSKASSCPHFSVFPLRNQLSKSKSHNRKRTSGNNNSGRQHERGGGEDNEDSTTPQTTAKLSLTQKQIDELPSNPSYSYQLLLFGCFRFGNNKRLSPPFWIINIPNSDISKPLIIVIPFMSLSFIMVSSLFRKYLYYGDIVARLLNVPYSLQS